ncbi:Lsr2 family protein [Micropruina sp.]|uniref:histone-like nucleoid-structuring protein Lsr2 n=1 Tax=Micropruina sp. TaxID=2737536 RepID=UPI00261DC70B|nr:Lsr2 family protein [Micropruina sp.]
MARTTVVTQIDDLDGTVADEAVNFAVDGVSYEIDLSSANAAALRGALSTYISGGRRVGGQIRPHGSGPARTDKEQLDAMRRWARENGFEVSDRGRISKAVREAYNTAR